MPLVGDLPFDKYLAHEALSSGGIGHILRSPMHYYQLHLNPERPERKATAAQRLGTLAHAMILEPATFDARYPVGPPVSKATKAWKEFAASLPLDVEPITEEEHKTVSRMRDAVTLHPELARLLNAGTPEVSAFWDDEETGVPCKARPDLVYTSANGIILMDLKTTGEAAEFHRQVGRLGYHRQAAWYTDGVEYLTGAKVLAFVFATVESAWPHGVKAFALDEEALDEGRRQCRAAVRKYAECKATKSWPGYSTEIEVLKLPGWAYSTEEPE